MKLINTQTNSLKSKTLGLALASVLIPAALASANGGNHYPSSSRNVSGHVEVVRQIPGGVVTVGAEWGKRRSEPAPVVIVQEAPRREVIVVEKVVEKRYGHGHHKHHGKRHGRGHGYGRDRHDREVTIIKTVPAREKVVVIEKREEYGHRRDRHDGHSNYYNDGKQVSYNRNDGNRQVSYYRDANQVSKTTVDPSGTYHYYEDANQVSIQDNRGGQQRHTYVRK